MDAWRNGRGRRKRPATPKSFDRTALLQEALAHHRAERYAEATAAYTRYLQCDPHHADAHHLLGLCYLEQHQPHRAVEHLAMAVQAGPGIPEFHADLAAGLAAAGDMGRAELALRAACERGLKTAIQLHRLGQGFLAVGDWRAAQRVFSLENRFCPRKEAANNLACAHLQLGDPDEALRLLDEVLADNPNDTTLLRNRGLALMRLERFAEARDCFECVLKADPRERVAGWQYALACQQLDDPQAAAAAWRRLAEVHPHDLDVQLACARGLEDHEPVDDVERRYREISERFADRPEPWRALGNVFLNARRAAEATEAFEAALRRDPHDVGTWNNLGLALQKLSLWQPAIDCFDQALRRQPDLTIARINRAATYVAAERWSEGLRELEQLPREAISEQMQNWIALLEGRCRAELDELEAAENLFRTVADRDPNNGQAALRLGEVLGRLQRWNEAETWFEEAARREPDNPLAWAKLGLVARKIGEGDRARHAFGQLEACEDTDDARYLKATSLPVIYRDEGDVIEHRRVLEQEIRELVERGCILDSDKSALNTTFYVAYQGFNDRTLNGQIATLWKNHRVPAISRPPARRGRLRIAFFSSFLKFHTVGKLIRGWIKELSRDRFEVWVVSPYEHRDAGADWIRAAADHRLLVSHDVRDALQQLASGSFDVLFFPEIGMDPLTYAVARHRVAPVQCVTWGHPVTTGLPHVDYFISSRLIEPPGAQDHYSEQLVEFATLPTYYYVPREPDRTLHRADFGLPDEGHIYLCPHSLFKFHPRFDHVLRKVLEADRSGQLVCIEGTYPNWTAMLRERFARTLPGLDDRIHFVKRQNPASYLRLVELSDIVLDSFPFGGGNTHYETVSVGVPFVTLPGEFMRGRVGLGIATKLGIEELVASDEDDYVRRAVELVNDQRLHDEIRRKIHDRKHRIFEDEQSVRELEDFLWKVCGKPSVARKTSSDDAVSEPLLAETKSGASASQSARRSSQGRCRQQKSNVRDDADASRTQHVMCPSTCPACGYHVATSFFDPGPLPLATLAWPASALEAWTMKRLPHTFVRCVDCGHVYNSQFKYEEVPYSEKPNRMFNRGVIWREHLESVARLLVSRLPPNPVVVEIGCGEGHMLRAMAEARPDGRYIGFDPNGEVDTGEGRIVARRELFDPAQHLDELRPHVIISRHVLEHLINPLGFVQALEFAVSWQGHAMQLFIEVPCIDHVFSLGRTTDFFYEHNSHFTTHSLRRMLERCHGRIELLETAYGGEVAYALATFTPRTQPAAFAREALDFASKARQGAQTIQQQLDTLARSGKCVVVWGGTGKAAAFIQQHGVDCERFALVVDSDPEKEGTYVPGAGQRIQPPQTLLGRPIDVVLIATPWRAADIVLEIETRGLVVQQVLVEYQGRLVDYHRDSHPYRVARPEADRRYRMDGPRPINVNTLAPSPISTYPIVSHPG